MLHVIKKKQMIKSDLDTVWRFISSPSNLSLITPDYMGFEIMGDIDNDSEMYAGQIIEYYLKPFAGIKMHWVTEITHIRYKEFFTDEQRLGPYRFWHHKHLLKEKDGAVEMTDIVHYKLPYGILGKLAHVLFVRNQLQDIFDFRYRKIEEIFN